MAFPETFAYPLPHPKPPHKKQEFTFTRLIPPDVIRQRTDQLAKTFVADRHARPFARRPLFLIVLRGAMQFGLDFAAAVTALDPNLEPEIDAIQYGSYGENTTSGTLRMHKGPSSSIEGRDTTIVDDILDRGNTLRAAYRYLEGQGPASLAIATLLQRENGVRNLIQTPPPPKETLHVRNPVATRGINPVLVDYAAFDLESGFVAGYGLDLGRDGGYRSWPGIYAPEDPFPRMYRPSRILGLNPGLVTGPDGQPITSWNGPSTLAPH